MKVWSDTLHHSPFILPPSSYLGYNPATMKQFASLIPPCLGGGVTKTETVTVSECIQSCYMVECPNISISGPDKIEGESTFTATVSGGTQEVASYRWSITNGEILEGQGTPSIRAIFWSNTADSTSSVTVDLGGLEKGGCVHSETKRFKGGVAQP